MATRLERLLAEQARRQAATGSAGGPGASAPPTPANTASNAPTAQEAMSTQGTAGPPALDLGQDRTMADVQGMSDQFGRRGPVTVGKRGLAQSMNAVMRERGMDYSDRADAVIGKGVADIGYGIKQLTVGLDEEEETGVEAWRALSEGASMDEGEGFLNAGTVGDIAGNVGALAVPLGAAEQALVKAGTALPRWASKVGAAMGVGGAEGGLHPVLGEESRAANVALGAAMPAALSGSVQAFRKGVTQPFMLSDAGQKLVNEGVVPTLGQGVEAAGTLFARLAKNVEENLEGVLPGISGGRKRAEDEVTAALARRAIAPGAPTPQAKPGTQDYFNEVKVHFDEAYDSLLDNPTLRTNKAPLEQGILEAIENNGMLVNPSLKAQMRKTLLGVLPEAGEVSGKYLKRLQKKVRDNLTKAASVENANENTIGSVEVLTAVDEHISDMLEAALGPEQARVLREVDLAYANRMLLETAAGFKRPDVDSIPVRNLDRAVRARTGRSRRIRGKGLGQDIVDPAFEAMGGAKPPRWVRALTGVGLGVGGGSLSLPATAAAAGAIATGTTRPGARAMFGLYAPQRRFKQRMDEIVEPKLGTATAMVYDRED